MPSYTDHMRPGELPTAFAQRILAPAIERRTPCGSGSMVWRIWGDPDRLTRRPPVVMLHGGSGSWRHWIHTIPALAPHYDLVVADLPGLGDSDMLPDPQTLEHVAQVVADGIRTLIPAPAPFHLLAFSYGSITGAHVAAALEDRIRSFTLIGTASFGLPWGPLPGRPRGDSPGMSLADKQAVHRHNLGIILLHDPARVDDLAVHLQTENRDRARLVTHKSADGDLLVQALPKVRAPLNLIFGSHDPYALPNLEEKAAIMRGFDPDLDFRTIPDAGHWVMYERPDETNAHVLEMLSNQRQRRLG